MCEEQNQKRIVFFSDNNSGLLNAMVTKLNTVKGYKATSCKMTVDCLHEDLKADIFVVHASRDYKIDEGFFFAMHDIVVKNNICVFLLGRDCNYERLKETVPSDNLKRTFPSPFDTTEVFNAIKEYLEPPKKILVVDDSGVMLRKMKAWLEPKYKAILSNSGMSAFKYLSNDRPDLILLDYEMPVCDGKQVLEMIRAESEFCDLPVIFLTNKDDKESIMSVMKLKPNGYILKTSGEKNVLAAIDKFFAER